MARKRLSDENILKLLREIELTLTGGSDVASACRSVGISDGTCWNWRKRFGGMGRSHLSGMKSLEKIECATKEDRGRARTGPADPQGKPEPPKAPGPDHRELRQAVIHTAELT
jgi:transposase-like protein